jgi:hypothetical protein
MSVCTAMLFRIFAKKIFTNEEIVHHNPDYCFGAGRHFYSNPFIV